MEINGSYFFSIFLYFFQYIVSSDNVASYIRVPVDIEDANDNRPEFYGKTGFNLYRGHTSTEFDAGTHVLSVFAVDLDGTAPNNEVCIYSFCGIIYFMDLVVYLFQLFPCY